jgi:hypothetical protein
LLLLLLWCSFCFGSCSPWFTVAVTCSTMVVSYEALIGERWPEQNLRWRFDWRELERERAGTYMIGAEIGGKLIKLILIYTRKLKENIGNGQWESRTFFLSIY